MNERGLSRYGLFLLAEDVSKASVYRWFKGVSRIDLNSARKLLEALDPDRRSPLLRAAEALLPVNGVEESLKERVVAQLKLRNLPRKRTLEALRTAGVPGFEIE
jgi:hypothetical protein